MLHQYAEVRWMKDLDYRSCAFFSKGMIISNELNETHPQCHCLLDLDSIDLTTDIINP